ncbi:fibronectin-like [Nelusetta ayraudi]|uniref:fibronectin-like n=1 Tax=Nelusetta ayraudi TaxID=303726 RepID=UPI003F71CDD7
MLLFARNISRVFHLSAPQNTDSFRVIWQNETSITLQWNTVNNNSFHLRFNGEQILIHAPGGNGPVNYTVSNLTAGTLYTFTLLTVFENIRSSGASIVAPTAPSNTNFFQAISSDETSITLKWSPVHNNSYILLIQFNDTELHVPASRGEGEVIHTVSKLTAGTLYTFTLFTVFENISSSGVNVTAATAPQNTDSFRVIWQNETSITLQWNTVNNNSFHLRFNGEQILIHAPGGNGPVNYTVSNLTAGTLYTFTLLTVFENIRSSGASIVAPTAPSNTNFFQAISSDETSITLKWSPVNNNSYILLIQFNGKELHVPASRGEGEVIHTVSSLTAGTLYTFTLFTVFENISSSGVNVTTATAPATTTFFHPISQNETSITLQWNKVNSSNFILQVDGVQIKISAPDAHGPVIHTVSSLTAGTLYTFTLFTVFENITSTGVNVTTATAPSNADSLISLRQDESSITLQWSKVSNSSFILQFDGVQTLIPAPDGNGPVNYTVSNLTAGILYTFTLFTVFENVTSSGRSLSAVTAPSNTNFFQAISSDETSITLKWSPVNNNSYILLIQFNGTELHVPASRGEGEVIHTVSNLTAGTLYTFTLFTVFENITSSGISVAAVTAPATTTFFHPISQNETSITLQWNKVNSSNFILQVDGVQIKISAPDAHGPVIHTVSKLTAGTLYTFTLFTVFENITSSGVNVTAATAPQNTDSFQAATQDETSITLQWNAVTKNSFILRFNGTYVHISAPDINGPINYTVSNLTAGTLYTFTLFTVFEETFSSGVSIKAATAPSNADSLISLRQDESSITLQWSKVSNSSFILQFDGVQTLIPAPDGNGPVNYTVSNLTAGILYTFTLFTVFENVTSSGRSLSAVTAPSNTNFFQAISSDETSITLKWSPVHNNSYILLIQFNDTELHVPASRGEGEVIHTVSKLTAGTLYTFTLFTVFENISSSGISVAAVTDLKSFAPIQQNETSITLQWKRVGNSSFILQFDGVQINIAAPDGNGPVNYTVSNLTAGTLYTFTLFTVLENIQKGRISTVAATAPKNTNSFQLVTQDESSITLQWNKVNNSSFILQFDGVQTLIPAPDGNGPVNYTVSSLTAGTLYTFTLFTVFENISSSGVNVTTATAPATTTFFHPISQNETSITLQWNKVNSSNFILQVDGVQIKISAPDAHGPVIHTVSKLTAGTLYTFTLFTVFENITSTGVNVTAATAPQNTDSFRVIWQNETSITLQWNTVNNNSFHLRFNGEQILIHAPGGNGPVNYTVSNLTAGTLYTFTLFTVFENTFSSGISVTALAGEIRHFVVRCIRVAHQRELSFTLI